MAEEPSGFLGRWSRRKLDARQGRALDEPALADNARLAPIAGTAPAALKSGPAAFAPASAPVPAPAAADPGHMADRTGTAPASSPASVAAGQVSSAAATTAVPDASAPAPAKILSLDDVKALTHDSDFKPFMARHVGADVRNAAMKKLFADPHYNVMDGLDIYIDDYTVVDPLPQAMLRQMSSAKFLNLFDDEEGDKNRKNAAARAVPTAQGDAASQTSSTLSAPDESLKKPGVQGLNQPDVQSLIQPDTDIMVQSAEPSMQVCSDSFPSLSADHASQPEPAAGWGTRQDHHAHTHLRLQPDHAASAPNPGRGTR